MFCNHKYGPVAGGYQYCDKCGKAIPVECSHIFVNIEKLTERGAYKQICNVIWIDRCKKCGLIRKTDTYD